VGTFRFGPISKGVFGLPVFCFHFNWKQKNGDENVFGWIFENIFSENENRKQPENENNKISFSVFSVENRNLILSKMKIRWQ